jgi:hypothetical protein
MGSTENLIEENRDTLETVAQADCSASWIAESLLDTLEGDRSDTTEDSLQTHIEATEEPKNRSEERSLFAY